MGCPGDSGSSPVPPPVRFCPYDSSKASLHVAKWSVSEIIKQNNRPSQALSRVYAEPGNHPGAMTNFTWGPGRHPPNPQGWLWPKQIPISKPCFAATSELFFRLQLSSSCITVQQPPPHAPGAPLPLFTSLATTATLLQKLRESYCGHFRFSFPVLLISSLGRQHTAPSKTPESECPEPVTMRPCRQMEVAAMQGRELRKVGSL